MTEANSQRPDETRQPAAEIEIEIRRTRAKLGLTLDALEHQLAPRQLIGKGVDMVTQSLKANETVWIDVGEAIRANRIPLAVIGGGVAWLIVANLGLGRGETQGAATSAEMSAPNSSRIGRNGVWVHQTADAARSVREAAGSVLERAGEYAEYARPAAERVRRAGRSLRGAVEQHPLLVGLAGLISGAAIAALLPSTSPEQDWVGEARGELWKRAEEIGHEAADRVRGLADHKAATGDG